MDTLENYTEMNAIITHYYIKIQLNSIQMEVMIAEKSKQKIFHTQITFEYS